MLLFSKKIVSVFQNLRFRQVKPMLLHCKTAVFALQNNSFCNAISILYITFIVFFCEHFMRVSLHKYPIDGRKSFTAKRLRLHTNLALICE